MRENWTDEQIRELVSLWPVASATQIAAQLHRPRSAICGKAKRLREMGILPRGALKHYDIEPWPARTWISSPPQFQYSGGSLSDDSTAMRPCTLIELDDRRCRWPLGEMHQVAAMFCGGAAVTGHSYCAEHMRLAHVQLPDPG